MYIILATCFFIFLPSLLSAGAYTPPGLYDPQIVSLENGLRVVLNPRHHARNVSFRIDVGMGGWDFPCGQREIAHFLEHMLFTGTSQYDGADLESMVTEYGGSWNAETRLDRTVYQLDIYSKHTDFGLKILHEIFTDSQLNDEQVELTRAVIEREAEGMPSAFQNWLYKRGVGVSGLNKVVEIIGFSCEGVELVDHITRDHLLAARDTFYVPGNMTLIAVGDFDTAAMLDQIKETFGKIPAGALTKRSAPNGERPVEPQVVDGLFSPFVGADNDVGYIFKVPGYVSESYTALALLENYLGLRLYEELRIDKGLSYTPNVHYIYYENQAIFAALSEVAPENADQALGLIRKELEQVMAGEFDEDTLASVRQGRLLTGVQGLESNSDVSDYYVESIGQLVTYGKFLDEETLVEEATSEELTEVAKRYLDPKQGLILKETPTLTFNQLYLAIGFPVIGMMGWTWRRRPR